MARSGTQSCAASSASWMRSVERRARSASPGKSIRACAPRLSSRRSAAITIIRPTMSRVACGLSRDCKRQENAGGRAQPFTVAQHAGRARQDRPNRSRIAACAYIRDRRHSQRLTRIVRGNILRDPAAAHRRLEQRVAGKPVCAMQAGAGGFAACPETVDRSPSGLIHQYAAHVIMRSRTNRDRLRNRIDSGFPAKRRDRRKTPREVEPLHIPRVEERAMSLRHVPPDRPRNDIAGSELGAGHVSHEAIAVFVDENSAFAAHGFAHELQRIGSCCRAPSGGTG